MKTAEQLLMPRWKVIASYPDSNFEVGDVLDRDWSRYQNDDETMPPIWSISQYPHLFKKLAWYEHQAIEDLKRVEYVKVIKYRGYWREGDIVPVESFEGGSIERAMPTGYVLKYKRYQPLFELEPATDEEYLIFKSKK